jgi:hypothetical protein
VHWGGRKKIKQIGRMNPTWSDLSEQRVPLRAADAKLNIAQPSLSLADVKDTVPGRFGEY